MMQFLSLVMLAVPLTTMGAPHQLLPSAVLAGYTSGANTTTILEAIDQGLNVLIWSFIELAGNISSPVTGGPPAKDVAALIKALQKRNQSVVHLVSIGGWGAPHPDTTLTGEEWWRVWRVWDQKFAKQVRGSGSHGSGADAWQGFDGVDMDAEGADNLSSPNNHFSEQLIHLIGTFAQAAKVDGYISSMVPAQSYLDCGSAAYDVQGTMNHADNWAPDFPYHGQNTYAPLLALYGDSYDLVIVQIYEGYSRAGQAILEDKMDPTEYLVALAQNYTRGWEVDFAGAFGLPQTQTIGVPGSKLVIGLGNGWAIPTKGKFLYLDGDAAGKAYSRADFRGFGYWDIHDDSASVGLVPKLAKYL